MKKTNLFVSLALLLPLSATIAAPGDAPTSGFFFQQCDATHHQPNNMAPFLLEIATDASQVLNQPLCGQTYRSKQSDDNWVVAFVPFNVLNHYDNNKISYRTIAQITDTSGSSNNGYSSYLIVNSDSDIYSLADLDHKKILASRKDSLSTSIYPQYVLGDFFKQHDIQFTYNSSDKYNLSALKSNKVSAAFVNKYITKDYSSDKYRVIMAFHWLPDYLVVVNNQMITKKQAKALKNMLLHQPSRLGFAFFKPDNDLINTFNKMNETSS